jgi:hypothetical protein
MSLVDQEQEFFFELGDIIKIIAPSNSDIDKITFYIDYLDENRATLVNPQTLDETVLNILDGQFTDKSIENIEILSRPNQKGYARQNGLTTGAWISIQFGGEMPLTLNGQITDLEQDMIELTTYGDNKKKYIDFAYRGIPLDLPIESIRLFEPPKVVEDIPDLDLSPEQDELEPLDEDDEGILEMQYVPDVSTHLKQVLLDADSISFGESLEEITELIPVKSSEKRFGLETQTNDLLDDLLSSIPTAKRTPLVLNQIHIMIERFKQLREMFSQLTDDGIDKPIVKTAQYKPLVDRLEKLDKKLYWLLPIVKNKKKLFNIEVDDEDADTDYVSTTLAESQTEIARLVNEFKNNRVPDGQNKYTYLYSNLNNLMDPVVLPSDKSNVMIQENVESNILAVTDNLEDFNSTVVKDGVIQNCRFVLNSYDLALTKITSADIKKPLSSGTRVPLVNNDKMAITGFLTLPEPALLYSKINLPSTSILEKSNLNGLIFNYFSILTRGTHVNEAYALEESDTMPTYTTDDFLEGFKSIKFSQTVSFNDRNESVAYRQFLEKMVPKTKTLFELVKKFILQHKTGVTYLSIIEYLEPFLIYPDDITFKQYETIVKFMEERIVALKRRFIEGTTNIQRFLKDTYGGIPKPDNSILFKLLDSTKVDVFTHYDLNQPESSDRVLNAMNSVDNMKLFSTAIALSDIDLYQPVDIHGIINNIHDETEKDIEKEKQSDTVCKNLVLSKQYMDIGEMRDDDNHTDVYFDSKYDTTRYDIGDEFTEVREGMSDDAYREFIFEHLRENVGLNEPEAIIESSALTAGKRKVSDGDYAYIDDDGKHLYYKRSNNMWVRDSESDDLKPGDNMFCNIKKSCLQIKTDCDTFPANRNKVRSELTKEILDQFDLEFNLEYQQLTDKLNKDLIYYQATLPMLKLIKLYRFLKTDMLMQTIGGKLQDREVMISPYANLRDHILSQADFVQKQSNILTFIRKLCRDANEGSVEPENNFWYYCKKTDIPLLPTFYGELAEAFQRGEYKTVLERICGQRGRLSDDGEKVVDKHSGYVIRTIEYDSGEGFNEAGYKIVSREVLERDIGEVLIDMSHKEMPGLQSPDADMIYKVLATLDKSMGIRMESEYDFVISNVVEEVKHYIGTKSNYNAKAKARQAKTGKNPPPYDRVHDDTLLTFTIAYYLVAIQTMMPSIITKKTFPGCVRSFMGFPLDPDGETSALMYIVCIALKLRQSARPWSALPKVSRRKEEDITLKFADKIKKRLDSIMDKSVIKYKLSGKRQYLEHHVEIDDIPELFDVKQWNTFLPPLFPVKIKQTSNISNNFKGTLIANLKKGSDNQFGQLNILRGKIIAFSFHVQELIQRVVNKEAPLIKNLSDEPMLENACCNEGIRETLRYFANKEGGITKYNDMVMNLESILAMVNEYEIANYIFSPLDTHLKYPQLSENFSEKTIYLSFLRFCEFNIPFSANIGHICKNPIIQRFTDEHSIDDKIELLKREGINITPDNFYQMLTSVNKTNIIDINLSQVVLSERKALDIKIKELRKKKAPVICNPEILTAFESLIDTFDTITDGNEESYLAMDTFLDTNNDHFQERIIQFLSNMNVTRGVKRFFDNMTDWKTRGENIYITSKDETSITMFTFYDTFIKNMTRIYPNMIMKGVDYKDVSLPTNWKISEKHINDVKSLIFGETSSLQKFYKDEELYPVLTYIQEQSKDIIELMDATNLFADLILNNKKIKGTIMNGNIINKLTKFYMLCSMFIYIKTIDMDLTADDMGEQEIHLLSLVDVGGMDNSIRDQIIEGKRDQLNKKIANLLGTYISIMQSQKTKLNLNSEDIIKNVLKAKEKEKNKITKNLGDLTKPEREVENILKEHRLGNWSLGQTRALYEYDSEQYDKERQVIEDDMLMELRLNNQDGVTDGNREIYRLEEVQEQVQRERVNAELMSAFMTIGDDDDFGDRDGDEGY